MSRKQRRAKDAAQIDIDRKVGRVVFMAKITPIEGEPAPYTYQRIIDAARELQRVNLITEQHRAQVVAHFQTKLANYARAQQRKHEAAATTASSTTASIAHPVTSEG